MGSSGLALLGKRISLFGPQGNRFAGDRRYRPRLVAHWPILGLLDNLALAAVGAFGEDFLAKRRLGPKPATIRRIVTVVADHRRPSPTKLDEAVAYIRSGELGTITRKHNQYPICSLVHHCFSRPHRLF